MPHYQQNKGFTIVELIVVIGVIAILTAIATVGYGSWRLQMLGNNVKSDLAGAAAAMNNARNFSTDSGYPASIPSTFTPSDDVSLNVFEYTNTTFCIDGVSSVDSSVQYYIDQNIAASGAEQGTCAARPSTTVPAAPANVRVSTVTNPTEANITWDMVSGVSNYVAQCASDPAFIYTLGEITTATNTATFTGLTVGATIYCRVKAANTTGTGAWSGTLAENTNYWTDFFPGSSTFYAKRQDGSLWVWGANDAYGSIGLGEFSSTMPNKLSPTKIPLLSGIESMRISSSVYALDDDGVMWGWGYNQSRNLGNGTTVDNPTPSTIMTGVASIGGGLGSFTAYAIKTDGSLWSWGYNNEGSVGNGNTTSQGTPYQTIASGAVEIKSASYSAFARKTDGTLWTWGNNTTYGVVGDGTTTDRLTPFQVLTGVAGVYPYGDTIYALKTDGTLWAWGNNTNGRVGNGTTTHQLTPVQILTGVSKIIPGNYASYAIKTDGSLWSWGVNSTYGVIGNNTTAQQLTPAQIVASGVAEVYVNSSDFTHMKKTDGSLWGWGRSQYYQMGNNSTATQLAPIQIIASGVSDLKSDGNAVMVLKTDKTVWTWGYGNYRQIGNGSSANRTTPYQTSITGATQIFMPFGNVFVLRENGSLWGWGSNGSSGDLGQGTTTSYYSTPVEIPH